jgi:hypothetical protein
VSSGAACALRWGAGSGSGSSSGGGSSGNSSNPITQDLGKAVNGVKTFWGLHWQAWLSIICCTAFILLVFYCCKGCLPCWGWSISLFKLAWCEHALPVIASFCWFLKQPTRCLRHACQRSVHMAAVPARRHCHNPILSEHAAAYEAACTDCSICVVAGTML